MFKQYVGLILTALTFSYSLCAMPTPQQAGPTHVTQENVAAPTNIPPQQDVVNIESFIEVHKEVLLAGRDLMSVAAAMSALFVGAYIILREDLCILIKHQDGDYEERCISPHTKTLITEGIGLGLLVLTFIYAKFRMDCFLRSGATVPSPA